MRQLFAAVSLVLAAPVLASAAPPVTSGAYNEAMLLAYDPATGAVSGYFDMTRGEAPSFSCIFYLHGKLSGASAAIDTYFPETPKDDLIKGKLVLSDATHFQVQLESEHGGCANVWSFADESQPATFDLATAHPWDAVAVVRSDKAYFYDAPGAAAHRRAYVVQGDGVGVRAARAGWVQVDYVGGDATVSGWLKASDLYPTP
ncbi:MAG TPA: hypothetical protein VN805_02450 [Caulobacteraceae bacterium]|nr:hypothetical protein [Caulobacteraceae bacterium]